MPLYNKMPRTREDRLFFLSIKICPVCRRKKLYYGEKTCIECRAVKNEYNIEYYQKHRDVLNEQNKIRNKNLYKERKEQGICVACGARKPAPGKVRCYICLDKNARDSRKKRLKKSGGEVDYG